MNSIYIAIVIQFSASACLWKVPNIFKWQPLYDRGWMEHSGTKDIEAPLVGPMGGTPAD